MRSKKVRKLDNTTANQHIIKFTSDQLFKSKIYERGMEKRMFIISVNSKNVIYHMSSRAETTYFSNGNLGL